MVATPSAIVEPVLGLDTEYRGSRPEWYNEDIFRKQPYMKFGIATDADFRAIRDGKTTENIYVAGSSLPGADSVNEGSGAGVAALTALLSRNISYAIAVLVVSCPCGHMLVSSAPMIAALAVATKRGILIKNSKFVE